MKMNKFLQENYVIEKITNFPHKIDLSADKFLSEV